MVHADTVHVQPDNGSIGCTDIHARRPRLAKVLTGGQSGVDRAATDVAIACGVAYGGWVPRGGWAEDFPTPPGLLAAYPAFTETPSDDPAVRTIYNVDDADGLLVLTLGSFGSPGTALALARAAQRAIPSASIDVRRAAAGRLLGDLAASLPPASTLNVAGPRESEEPGIYASVRRFLEAHVGTLVG